MFGIGEETKKEVKEILDTKNLDDYKKTVEKYNGLELNSGEFKKVMQR